MCFIALDHGGIRKVGVLIGWKNSARTQGSLRDNEFFFCGGKSTMMISDGNILFTAKVPAPTRQNARSSSSSAQEAQEAT